MHPPLGSPWLSGWHSIHWATPARAWFDLSIAFRLPSFLNVLSSLVSVMSYSLDFLSFFLFFFKYTYFFTCPEWESNQQPFGLQAHAQSIELHQPGPLNFLSVPQVASYSLSWPPFLPTALNVDSPQVSAFGLFSSLTVHRASPDVSVRMCQLSKGRKHSWDSNKKRICYSI